MNGVKVELVPKIPKENQRVCEHCDGIGWLYDQEQKFMEKCSKCYSGLIDICSRCGNDTRGYCNDTDCRTEREIESEERLFDKAIKITREQAKEMGIEMVYHEGYGYNNGYIEDLSDFISCCEDDEVDIPKYVWGTTYVDISLDAYSILENACEELHEDAMGNISQKAIDELQDYLNDWCEEQTGTKTYWQDTRYAILI